MIKRMFISLTLLGLAAFAMGGAAIAFFQTDESAPVAIQAGTTDIDIAVAVDCSGPYLTPAGAGLSWTGIVPGDTAQDCIQVSNSGDGDLNVHLTFTNRTGQLRNHVTFTTFHSGTQLASNVVDAPAYTSANGGRGLSLFSLDEGETKTFRVEAQFNESGSNQNGLEGGTLDFTAVVTGYTG